MIRRTVTLGLVAAVLALSAASAQAANPHDGDWEAVESKSIWSDGKLPTGFKLVITLKFSDNKLVYHGENTTNAGAVYRTDHVTTLDGKVFPFENQTRFNQVSVTVTGPDDMQVLKLKDGDVVAGEFWTFSKDGKTAIRRGVAKDPEGHSKAYQEFFQRK